MIAILFGPKGPNTCVVTACAQSPLLYRDAFRAIVYRAMRNHDRRSGTEANITPLTVGGFMR